MITSLPLHGSPPGPYPGSSPPCARAGWIPWPFALFLFNPALLWDIILVLLYFFSPRNPSLEVRQDIGPILSLHRFYCRARLWVTTVCIPQWKQRQQQQLLLLLLLVVYYLVTPARKSARTLSRFFSSMRPCRLETVFLNSTCMRCNRSVIIGSRSSHSSKSPRNPSPEVRQDLIPVLLLHASVQAGDRVPVLLEHDR